jgi:fructose-1,6-bisphosphatase
LKQKINNEILDLSHNRDQIDLANVYRIVHPNIAQYTFFSDAHGIFSKIYHILRNKASLSNYKIIEIIPCILSDHNRLELSNKNNNKKHANSWKLNKTVLNVNG